MKRNACVLASLLPLIWGCPGTDADNFDATPPRADASISPVDSGGGHDAGAGQDAVGLDTAAAQDAARPDTATAQDAARSDTATTQDAARSDTATTQDAARPDVPVDCSADCAALRYTACTCGPDDPCGWIGDGYCDLRPVGSSCDVFEPHFDDSADCADPGVELNAGWVGGACGSPADCDYTGYTQSAQCELDASGFPNGLCTQACTQSATSGNWICPDADSGDIGAGYTVTRCIEAGTGSARCVAECDFDQSPSGCRPGYACVLRQRYGSAASIYPVCLPSAVQAWPGESAPPFDIGGPCSGDSDCGFLHCLSMTGGYCTKTMCDTAGCPSGSRCFGIRDGVDPYTGGDLYVCLDDCANDSDCRQGESYVCDPEGDICWPGITSAPWVSSVGAADCADAWPAGLSDCDAVTNDYIVVNKAARNLALCSGGTLVENYRADLGFSPVGDKVRQGDGKTPEGIFYVAQRIPEGQTSYYKAFMVSYPDAEDAARGLSNGWITQSQHDQIVAAQNSCTTPPQNTQLGGLIEVHGMGGVGQDWTAGCVGLADSAIDDLWAVLEVGDSIVVLPD